MTEKVDLYPTFKNVNFDNSFRLSEISKLKVKLEDEVSERKQLCKKYKRAENILDAVDICANSIAMSLSVTSGVLASTGILLPVAIPLAVSAGTLGVVGVTCKCVNRKLKAKSQKHSSIKQIAESKLNSVIEIVNKAINDNTITDDEFKLVVDEITKYNTMKEKIQTKVVSYDNTVISEEAKNAIITQAKKDFISQLK